MMDGNAGESIGISDTDLKLRRYEERDRESVRRICCRTAYRSGGSHLFFEDDDLFADYWTEYYLTHETRFCYVVELENCVVGYLLGCPDSRRHLKLMRSKIVPRLVVKLLWRLLTFRFRHWKSYRFIFWFFSCSWREALNLPLDRFPAHYHMNVLPQASFKKGFSTLVLKYLEDLQLNSVPGIYGVILEPLSGGWFTRLISRAEWVGLSHEYRDELRTRMYHIVLGDPTPMVNRVYASSVESYRRFVIFLRNQYNL